MTESKNIITIKKALFSCWKKEEALILAKKLHSLGVKIIASGGTATAFEQAGIEVERIEGLTGFDNLLGGRVKTLHPAIYASILSRADNDADQQDLKDHNVEPVQLVVVDLYPFPEAGQELEFNKAVELIDIGGVSLIRAAAKNFKFSTVLCHSGQFEKFAQSIDRNGLQIDEQTRLDYCVEAFQFTSNYDLRIADRLGGNAGDHISLSLKRQSDIRYGENPHQSAGFFIHSTEKPYGIGAAIQHAGKQLSFNNLLDLDIALRLPKEFTSPAAAILKHTTPCGVGLGDNLLEAFKNARSTDPVSAFGGIMGFNRIVDEETAHTLREGFVEVVAAPSYTENALKELKRSKNLRVIELSEHLPSKEWDFRSIFGGMLGQERDFGFPEFNELKTVTAKQPNAIEMEALKFAWIIVRYIKSNAILIADNQRTIGIGAGQMSRVDAAHLAVWKARQNKLEIAGTVAASDAFFPFRDGLDVLADAGVTSIIQPGGSVRDNEVIDAANERGISMVFTGRRHFRH